MDYISSELVETLTDVLKIESLGQSLELETKQGRGRVMERRRPNGVPYSTRRARREAPIAASAAASPCLPASRCAMLSSYGQTFAVSGLAS